MRNCFDSFSTEDAALNSFLGASILSGSDRRGRPPSLPPTLAFTRLDQPSQIEDDEVISNDKWPIHTAQAVSKVAQKMQYELSGGELISYFIEWCDAPHQRRSGVAYSDAIILYDVDNKPLILATTRAPQNNIDAGFQRGL